ncbi:MAG: type II secretion system protein [Oscillospiraceae bacterium]|nr:type II secretion system protein [Oscillospiraceae bacterium]
MKAKLKGFTLIELIIVMVILTILMAAIVQMFKPIRATYVDSTLYEARRTTQNGIIQYIGESIRYATDLGIYQEDNIDDAVEEFAKNYCRKNPKADKDDVIKNAEVIIIDNTATVSGGEITSSPYKFNDKFYMGRVLRRKNVGTSNLSESRLALGEAYYGTSNYAIKISKPTGDVDNIWSASEGILITVASTIEYGNAGLQRTEGIIESGTFNDDVVKTEGLVFCPNLAEIDGLFDVMSDDSLTDTATSSISSDSSSISSSSSISVPPAVNFFPYDTDNTGGTVSSVSGSGGGTSPSASATAPTSSYSDTVTYLQTGVVTPNTLVYIVFLNEKV